jgi:TRAP-type mannitol/chloroaromatic compound transport system permease small subunit
MTQPPPPGYPPQQPPAGQAPNNYLVLSIVGLIFCLIPGIVAVVKASQVNGLWAQGQYAEAQASADGAKKWATWSIILGVVAGVIYVILAVIGGMAAQNTSAAMLAAMF